MLPARAGAVQSCWVHFPNYAAKHTQVTTPVVTAERMVRHLRERGLLEGYLAPRAVILLYERRFASSLLEREPHRSSLLYPDQLFFLDRTDGRVGVVARFGIGAPAVSIIVETLVALGTTQFFNLGTAGGLQQDTRVGDLVVCDRAVRDEGVSHHYLSPARYARPSAGLTAAFAAQLESTDHAFRIGPSWTIDAPYRETLEELRHYRDEGVLTVEMEAAALFAVSEHLKVEAAAGFVLSDLLTESEWAPDFGSEAIQGGLQVLVNAAINTVLAPAPRQAP
jgi:uridine phosphorylase